MKTYEERLQEYAQEHADKWNDINIGPNSWEVKRNSGNMINEAKVTIAAVAEGIEKFATSQWQGEYGKIVAEKYLIENGYKPKTQ